MSSIVQTRVSAPLQYDFLSVDPDILRLVWTNRNDYVVVGLGQLLREPVQAEVVVTWLRDHVDTQTRSAHARAQTPAIPDVVYRISGDLCDGGTVVRGRTTRRCGACLRCGFVLEPIDGFALEFWLAEVLSAAPEVIYESTGPGSDFVALWGLITISWTWAALVSLLKIPELQGAGMADPNDGSNAARLWSLMLKYLTLKSPRAALQALADRAHPDDVIVTRRDFVPLLAHEDREVRDRALCLLREYFGSEAC